MTMEFEQQVRTRAYEIWEREGYPDGRALDHWEQAAQEVDQLLRAAVAPVMTDAVKAIPSSTKSAKKAAAPTAKSQRRSARTHQSLN